MKIKLDENLPAELADLFGAANDDVHTVVGEQLAGRDDQTIFRAATTEGRVLVTQDMDFSDSRRFAPGQHKGILLLRLHSASRRDLLQRVQELFRNENVAKWSGCFVVATERKLRVLRPAAK